MKKAIAGIFGATWITLAGSASAATQLTSLSEASEALRELPQGAITQQILDPIELESTRGGMVPLAIALGVASFDLALMGFYWGFTFLITHPQAHLLIHSYLKSEERRYER